MVWQGKRMKKFYRMWREFYHHKIHLTQLSSFQSRYLCYAIKLCSETDLSKMSDINKISDRLVNTCSIPHHTYLPSLSFHLFSFLGWWLLRPLCVFFANRTSPVYAAAPAFPCAASRLIVVSSGALDSLPYTASISLLHVVPTSVDEAASSCFLFHGLIDRMLRNQIELALQMRWEDGGELFHGHAAVTSFLSPRYVATEEELLLLERCRTC